MCFFAEWTFLQPFTLPYNLFLFINKNHLDYYSFQVKKNFTVRVSKMRLLKQKNSVGGRQTPPPQPV